MARNPNIDQDESIEQLRKWWFNNGRYLVSGVVVGIAVVVGWAFWDKQEEQKLQEASEYYHELTQLIAPPTTDLGNTEEVSEQTRNENDQRIHIIFSKLQNEYLSTPYTPMSALLMAKYYIAQNNLSRGEEYLETALQSAVKQEIKFLEGLVAIRLSRVQWAQGKKEQARNTLLSTQFTSSFQAIADEIIADRLASEEKKQEAFNLYDNSRKTLDDPSGYIDMKIQRLGINPSVKKDQAK